MKKLICIASMAVVAVAMSAQQHKLWYNKPASHWLEALPIGNSSLGAMVFGGTETEEIQLNEETFWSGSPHNNDSKESLAALPEVRRLIFEGKEYQASKLIDQHFVKGPHGMRFLPLGSVKLKLDHKDFSNYRRELNLGNAIATTSYTCDGVKYERTVFASQADNVIIVQLKANKKKKLEFEVDFTSQLKAQVFGVKEREGVSVNELAAVVDGVEQEGVKAGLKAECRISVETDGKIERKVHSLEVDDATTATLYITAATNFVNYHDVSGNPVKKNNETLDGLKGKSYKQLLNDHIKKYQEQYNRVQLTLGNKADKTGLDKPTDERLGAFDGTDLDMVSLMMQYGRYLLISSSQPGGQPANLQGVWNDKMNAPWDSKYTININAEMNYWPALIGNLAETQEPLFEMTRELSETGAKTAKEMYDCKGWVAHNSCWTICRPTPLQARSNRLPAG